MSYKLSYTGQQVQNYLDKVATGQAGGGTGDYNELEHIPVINQDLSGEGFLPIINTYYKHTGETTGLFTQGMIYLHTGTTYKALDGEVPTKISQLTNDSGYTTNKGTVTSVAVKMNDSEKGKVTSSGIIDLGTVLTAHQDISGKQDKITSNKKLAASLVSGLAAVATSGSYNDLLNKPTIPSAPTNYVTTDTAQVIESEKTFEDIIGTTVILGSSVEIKAASQGLSQFKVLDIHNGTVINITGEDSGLVAIEAPIALGGNKGTAGQVLISQGASDTPQWRTPAIQSASLSGTTLTLTL